ncbi:chromosome segregation ATPase [Methanohalophilus levihalophilus]|uniref:hypothetical protein n=1 Tax=Methanohalophilus levihalophilus TaxID=1431282 RepID=UPI001AEB1474|nr:hypothetical protein [Methanohalophilus levihalophilus]MBP2029143.1 chromosome segregation ATPase [Methanohalophilus levihalophilus]
MSENSESAVKTLDREGLIKAVIEKHERLISEYNTEYNSLEGKVKELKEKVAAAKKEHEDTVQRMDVLREKRQQLYYQAKKLLEDLEPGTIEDRLVHSIHDDIEELKRLKEPETEAALRKTLLDKINSIRVEEIKEQVSQLTEKIKGAEEATIELLSLETNRKDSSKDNENMAEELKKDEPRHNWLHRRIASHTEAREYWEKQLEGTQKSEETA